jgi:hypothetical protein
MAQKMHGGCGLVLLWAARSIRNRISLRSPQQLVRRAIKIRAGYEISYDCPQPTPMILQLSVRPERVPDLVSLGRIHFDPPPPANTYDSFGNYCHVIRAGEPLDHVDRFPDP